VSAWLPIGTLVGGYVLKALDDLRKEHREDRLEGERRQAQLDDERRHREADFQRETLLELQEALHALIRVATKDMLERAADMQHRNVPYSESKSTDETSEEERGLLGRVFVLQVRVKDDKTRELTDAVTAGLSSPQAVISDSPTQATLVLNHVWQAFGALNDHVGELIRDQY